MVLQGLIILLISKTVFAYTSSICAEVPNGYFVRSSQSCDSFNRCDNGQPSHGMCPKGFSFNPLSQTCNHNIDVDCQLCSSYGIQNIPHPDNCAMYYRCVNGKRTSMTCPDELLFDRFYGDCNFAQKVICETKNRICEQFRHLDWLGAILIGNPLDCSSYYYCINGRAIESVCPDGLFYNPYTAACEALETVNFCQGIGPIITTPLPEFTTREDWTTQSTTKTTARIIYVTKPSTTTAPTTLQTTTQSTTQSTTTRSTTSTTTSTTTVSTTTEMTTVTTQTTVATTSNLWATSESIIMPCPVGVTGYFEMPPPDNCKSYYYCSRGTFRYVLNCIGESQFYTPGNNQCTADVPPGCEHLVE